MQTVFRYSPLSEHHLHWLQKVVFYVPGHIKVSPYNNHRAHSRPHCKPFEIIFTEVPCNPSCLIRIVLSEGMPQSPPLRVSAFIDPSDDFQLQQMNVRIIVQLPDKYDPLRLNFSKDRIEALWFMIAKWNILCWQRCAPGHKKKGKRKKYFFMLKYIT